ncbi:MAG: hypothetical protein PHT33_08120 [bacterium]|nr:hypothetical protein [bacterium]
MKLKIEYLIPVIITAGLLVLCFVLLRPERSWNQGVEDTVAAISRGIIDKDLRTIITRVDRSYSDAYGNKYDDLKWRLALDFRRQGTPTVNIDIIDMKRTGINSASARLKCNVVMPDASMIYNGEAQVEFSFKGRTWVVSSVKALDERLLQELQEGQ